MGELELGFGSKLPCSEPISATHGDCDIGGTIHSTESASCSQAATSISKLALLCTGAARAVVSWGLNR